MPREAVWCTLYVMLYRTVAKSLNPALNPEHSVKSLNCFQVISR